MPRTKKAAHLKRLQTRDRDQRFYHPSPDPHHIMNNHKPQTSANMQSTTKSKLSRNERRKRQKNARKAALTKPADPSIPPKDSCPFLEAPAEIRLAIYKRLMNIYKPEVQIGWPYNSDLPDPGLDNLPLITSYGTIKQVLRTLLTCSVVRDELFAIIAEKLLIRVAAESCKYKDIPKYFRRVILPKVQKVEMDNYSSRFPLGKMIGLKQVKVVDGEHIHLAKIDVAKETVIDLVPYLIGDRDGEFFDAYLLETLRLDSNESKPAWTRSFSKLMNLSKKGIDVEIVCCVKVLLRLTTDKKWRFTRTVSSRVFELSFPC